METIKCGIPVNVYYNIHTWLMRKYGSAYHCENPNCKKCSKKYHWCLIKGKSYEKNRDNFMQLCVSCHIEYDYTEERREQRSKITKEYFSNPLNKEAHRKKCLGRVVSKATREKMSKNRSGKGNPMFGVKITGKDNHMYGKKHTLDSKKQMAAKHRTLNQTQVNIIKSAVNYGCLQSELVKIFNSNASTINKIVKGKTYKIW